MLCRIGPNPRNCVYIASLTLVFCVLIGFPCKVHSENGTRLGCGIIELVNNNELLVTSTDGISKSNVTGEVTVYAYNDTACYFGFATNLEPNLMSFLQGGPDCNSTNGCGVHIHAGSDCSNKTTQGDHYYNRTLLEDDPWAITSYLSTDEQGLAYYTGCVETGETTFGNRTFIVHSNNGSRLSCGILQADRVPAPVPTPVKPPTRKRCGLFGLSIFCFNGCGLIRRLLGLC
jgi:hypothetical protein